MEKILIGKIVNAVSLKGEVKVYTYSEPERYEELDEIILEKKRKSTVYGIEKVRYQKNMVILKLKGVDDRNAAELLKDSEIYITEDDLKELPEDQYYIRDLIGCVAVDSETGDKIGEVTGVLQNSAQDNYEIRTVSGKTVLIPAVKQFVKEINVAEKKIVLSLIPGFLDDAIEA